MATERSVRLLLQGSTRCHCPRASDTGKETLVWRPRLVQPIASSSRSKQPLRSSGEQTEEFKEFKELVEAMVLSGCRISSSLTKYELQTKGGTYRRQQGTEQPKRTQGKPNRHRSGWASEELSSGAQDR